MAAARRPLLLALLTGLVGCGGDGDRTAPTPPAPGPSASSGSGADLSRGALSARLRAALDRGDIDAAAAALEALRREHGGAGELPDGRSLSAEAMLGAVFDAAIAASRAAVSGPAPDRPRAERAQALADSLAPEVTDEQGRGALAAARRWLELDRLGALATALAPHPGPRVVLAADDFDLGEPDLLRTLARWAREGAAAGLRVGLVPLHRGYVRVGTRRTRAADRDEERRAVAARLAGSGVVLEPEPAQAAAAAADLGLLGQDLALLVADRDGRVVARVSGRAPDLAALERVVQRVGSR